MTDTDRDKYCVQRIMDFYARHRVDYADYFLAAWRFQSRESLGKPNSTLAEFARDAGLSARYLATVYAVLTQPPGKSGPLAEIQARWRALPQDVQKKEHLRRQCEGLRDLVIRLRKELTPRPEVLRVRGVSPGSQPFVLWRNRQIAEQHVLPGQEISDKANPTLNFCRVFPDAFVVTERAPFYDSSTSAKGRLLSAGFHLMTGYFRDDGPLYELVLEESERREIDRLWEELHFVTRDALRQYKDFIFFERAEPPRFMFDAVFDFARSEDKDAGSEANIKKLRDVYLAKARKNGANAVAIQAMETYFAEIADQINHVEQARRDAEPSHLAALESFASRAYRRPLSVKERDDLLTFYKSLRREEHLSHEDALRDSVASILLSPNFCYRLDLPSAEEGVHPLPDYALASRLSYFLWSSMPDAELLSHAAAGDLHQPTVLVAQARRMLRDGRIRALAEQFAANWLEFRRFEESNTVDRGRFPSFSNELRQAMAEEPIHFFLHVVSQDRPVLDFLAADYTFVNPVLAKHYGIHLPVVGPTSG